MKFAVPFAVAVGFATLASAQPAPKPNGPWVIHAGTLIDGHSAKPRTRVSIHVDKGRITKVTRGFAAGEKIIDLSRYTVLPGLIDMHTHLSGELSRKSYSEGFFLDPADVVLRAAVYAERTLLAGFTTVRDLGDTDNITVSLKRAIQEGWATGPRIFTAAKALATTGGHADPTNGHSQKLRGNPGPRDGVINGARDAQAAVRHRYKDGADLIKLTATGGVLSLAANGQNPQFTDSELKAVVKAARDYGMKVAVHAHGTEGMKRAVLAGVDSIEHGTYLTRDVMKLMKARGTYLVPTLSAGKFVAAKADDGDWLPKIVRPKARVIGRRMTQTFAQAVKAKVNIAFGTDSGVSPHGDNAKEFVYMVEAGMTPMAAIQSATKAAAKLLGQERKLGTITRSKLADIIAVDGNPLRDIRTMQNVVFVMKEGTVAKRP